MPTRREDYIAAKRHVDALRGLYIHGIVFALVMTTLVIINATGNGAWWVQWPLLGWGLGLVVHAVAVFMSPVRVFGAAWEHRKIRERLCRG